MTNSPAPLSPIEYRPQIDTLRAIAVGSVMFEHYLPYYFNRLGLMDGVLIFFCISGYLITGILLKYKTAAEGVHGGFSAAFGTFYARRALRIFPPFYLLLLLLLVTGQVQETFWWHATYATNFWTALENRWDEGAGHFWSLAVEEQFYLVWPLVVLAAPKRTLPWLMIAGIACGPLFRLYAQQANLGLAIITMPMANFDALLGGALLAWAHRTKDVRFLPLWRKHGALTLLCAPALYFTPDSFNQVWAPTMVALLSAYLIDQCVLGFKGALGWLFSIPIVLYLGRISYGLYLYHYVVPHFVGYDGFQFAGAFSQFVRAIVWGLVTLGCAVISWHTFEQPINRLKRHFRWPERVAEQPKIARA